MAQSMFTNPYDAAIAQRDASQKRATQAGAVPWYRQGAVSGSLIGQDLGRSLGGMLGMQTPEQAKQDKIEEIMGQYGEGAKSYEQLMQIADSFRSANMPDLWQEVMDMADKLKPTESTDMKKWQYQIAGHKQAIADYAKSKNYTLTDRQLDNLVSSTKAKPIFNVNTGGLISGWGDIVDQALAGMKPDVAETGDSSDEGNVSATPSVSTSASHPANIKALESMNTQFGVEVKSSRENLKTIDAGLNIVNQVRDGNISSMPQLERMLAKFNSDNRISVPEVKQVMKIGGLGDRITDSITRFMKGDLSPGTLNDIEEMLVRMGQLDQSNYNAKVSDYRGKYNKRFSKEDLEQWLPFNDSKFYTARQKQELWEQEMRSRGLK